MFFFSHLFINSEFHFSVVKGPVFWSLHCLVHALVYFLRMRGSFVFNVKLWKATTESNLIVGIVSEVTTRLERME